MSEPESSLAILLRLEREIRASSPRLPQQTEAPTLWNGLSFRVGEQRLVVELGNVGEVVQPVPVTPVPLTRPWLLGVANVRGELLTIVDLAQYSGMQPVQPDDQSRLLIVNMPSIRSAVLVAEVTGMKHFAQEDRVEVEPGSGPMAAFIRGAFVQEGVRYEWLDLLALARSDRYMHAAA